MKKYITFAAFIPFVLLTISFSFFNTGIDFKLGETYSFESIKEEAVKADKIIFVDLFATWCGPCKKMEAEVFNQEAVGEKYNEAFVNYKVNIQSPEGAKVAKRYNINSYPTYLFLKPNGEVLYRLEGVFTPAGMIEEADFTLGLE
ncbi:thioredoxin domain-containing protein [uncultured Arcticibacterium sp.]|uniref:thioredoxin family protein n=1 Tax=uncultured Arcticibacterium sp. TaxID=2173042 RepID=UPI0030FB7339